MFFTMSKWHRKKKDPRLTKSAIFKIGIWLTLPPLLFSLSLMNFLPNALTSAQFNQGVPDALITAERIGRIFAFAMPTFFSVGLSTTTHKRGLVVYVIGVALYCLAYGIQNLFPSSSWSTSALGFAASAYTNVFWMIGLGLLGERFYFTQHLRYRPIFYILPAVIFTAFHTTHTLLHHQRTV